MVELDVEVMNAEREVKIGKVISRLEDHLEHKIKLIIKHRIENGKSIEDSLKYIYHELAQKIVEWNSMYDQDIVNIALERYASKHDYSHIIE